LCIIATTVHYFSLLALHGASAASCNNIIISSHQPKGNVGTSDEYNVGTSNEYDSDDGERESMSEEDDSDGGVHDMAAHYQEWADAAVARLLANDPQKKIELINVQHHRHDPAAVARALRLNRYVNNIWFDVGRDVAGEADFEPFFREVSERGMLEKVHLMGAGSPLLPNWQLPSIHSRPCLEAFQRNDSITNMCFSQLVLSENDVASVLDHSTSISNFSMDDCELESQEDAAAIATALGRSTTIKSL